MANVKSCSVVANSVVDLWTVYLVFCPVWQVIELGYLPKWELGHRDEVERKGSWGWSVMSTGGM